MAVKTVCDICGNDANQIEYVLPIYKKYYAEMKNGTKLLPFENIEPCKMNLCGVCNNRIAAFLSMLCEQNDGE